MRLLARETRFSENSAALIGEQASNSVIARRFALTSTPSAITDSGKFRSYPDRFHSFGATVRSLTAELGSTPQRWRRALRIALTTAIGAGLTAALQIGNPLGLTLLFNFAAPEMAIGFTASVRFLLGAAVVQTLGLALCGAMVDSAIPHVTIFIILCLATSYLIYADPRIGRLWVWVQVPVLTAFYLAIFDPVGLGWDAEQAFAGVAVAVVILYATNTLLWPRPAAQVLGESLAHTLERSRRRLGLLLDIWSGDRDPTDDRPVASQLGYHLTLLGPAAGHSAGVETPAALLAAVMVAERIHNEIDRVAALVSAAAPAAMSVELRDGLFQAAAQLDAMLERYLVELGDLGGPGAGAGGGSPPLQHPAAQPGSAGPPPAAALRTLLARLGEGSAGAAGQAGRSGAALIARLENLCDLLEIHPAELPLPSLFADSALSPLPDQSHGDGNRSDTLQPPLPESVTESHSDPSTPLPFTPYRRRLNRFLLRYSARHTIAMALAFVTGLFANNPALHAALWLLMIGGPPSHGATVRKFTMRAIGAAAALGLAVLATILVSPSATNVFPYMVATFMGVLVMAYIGEGGGLLSYLSIGGTAFVIAFSSLGPRADAFASIWTIWGISFGMLIRAGVSIFWPERASRTLVEEFQAPLESMLELVAAAHRRSRDPAAVWQAQVTLISGIRMMLAIANDGQLEGRRAGIDAANLVDALDTLRRVGFILGNRALGNPESADTTGDGEAQSLEAALHAQFADWLESLWIQDAEGVPNLAPLREMVMSCQAPELTGWPAATGEDARVIALMRTLQEQLKTVSLH